MTTRNKLSATAMSAMGDIAYRRVDFAAATRVYREAADQGSADAQYSLALLYDTGLGVPQDSAAAASWLRKAANQGHTSAQYHLGSMYYSGQGVPRDYAAAASWYRKIPDQGTLERYA